MKKIKSSDLIKLGFDENFVSAEESGDTEYTYYIFSVGNDCLFISDEVSDKNNHTINLFNFSENVEIRNLKDLTTLIKIIKRNISEK